MNGFEHIKPEMVTDNYIRLIGKDWMLITAGNQECFNTMTASWGGVGFLWNKSVVFAFVRPQRYTYGFMEEREEFTLSFFDEKYRKALQVCGTLSGREVNKVEKAGLTPCTTDSGNMTFRESRLILECRKLYTDMIRLEAVIDKKLTGQWYSESDFHRMYVAEIVKVWEKNE